MKPYVLTVTLNPAVDKTVTIDKFKLGGLNRLQITKADPGGKGINVAKALHKFRISTTATGFIAGYQGKLILDYLEAEGIEHNFREIPGETRTNLKLFEEFSGSTTEINEPGFTVRKEDLDSFKMIINDHLNNASFLVLSGSLPPGVEDNIYYELIQIARNKGVKTILDTDGQALLKGIEAIPFAIKPNSYELELLTGQKIKTIYDVKKALEPLISKGIEIAIASMGGEGAVVANRVETYHAETFHIIPKSTVGAGDSMVAALIYSLMNNFALREIAQWVTAAGTVTASNPGTEVCSLEEVKNSINYVKVKKL